MKKRENRQKAVKKEIIIGIVLSVIQTHFSTIPRSLQRFFIPMHYNYTLIERFFQKLFGNIDGYIDLRVFPEIRLDDRPRSQFFFHTSEIDKAIEFIQKHCENRNVYVGVALRKDTSSGSKDNLKTVKAVWIDVDSDKDGRTKDEVVKQLKKWILPPSMIIDSGHGIHAYWILKEPTDDFDLIEEINSGLAKVFNGDPAVFDATRIMRVPGTLNVKKEPVPVEILEVNDREYSLFDLEEWKEEIPRYDPSTHLTVEKRFPDEIVDQVIEECPFLKHCKEDAKTLSEPEWYCMITNLTALGAIDKIHELSRPYQKGSNRYSYEETQKKIEHARKDAPGPHTCDYIRILTGDQYCKQCKWRSKVKAPAGIAWKISKRIKIFDGVVDNSGRISKKKFIEALLKSGAISDLSYDPESDRFYLWNGTYHEYVREIDVKRKIQELARREGIIVLDDALSIIVKTLKSFSKEVPKLPPPKKVIPVKNGVLKPIRKIGDVIEWELEPHSPYNANRYVFPVVYDPEAKAPRWEKFLEEVIPSEADRLLIQEYIGYMLIPLNVLNLQKALILYGTGANGKSTFTNVIYHLLGGSQTVSSLRIDQLEGFHVVEIVDKIANIANEITSSGKHIDTRTWKQIIAGDVITINPKYAQPFQYRPIAKHAYAVNDLPQVFDTSEGFFRRLIIVRFPVHIPAEKQDPQLEQKLLRELSGIFNWALEGLERVLIQNGFTISQNTRALIEEYRKRTNIVLQWIEERITSCEDGKVTSEELFEDFKQWCKDSGHHTWGSEQFFREFSKAIKRFEWNVKSIKIQKNKRQKRGYGGICLM